MGGIELKPIIFSTPMVRALIRSHNPKTQTRRIVKPQPVLMRGGESEFDAGDYWHWNDYQWLDGDLGVPESAIEDYAPYKVGDVLWVRETWNKACGNIPCDMGMCQDKEGYIYKADIYGDVPVKSWKPSIHMPKEAARLFLKVTDVRVERLQDINYVHGDIWAEGIPAVHDRNSEENAFIELWDSINAKRGYGWDKNPFVWVISFERIRDVP